MQTKSVVAKLTPSLIWVKGALRRWALAEGIALVALGTFALLWASFVMDFTFKPEFAIRRVFLALIGIGAVGLFLWYVVWRVMAEINNQSVALLIERKFPTLSDRLMTAIELSNRDHGYSSAMVDNTAIQAEDTLKGLQLGDVLNRRKALQFWGLVLVMTIFSTTFVNLAPAYADAWFKRVILLQAGARYPHATTLVVEGFEDGKTVKKVALGTDVKVVVRIKEGTVQPKRCEISYSLNSGRGDKVLMTEKGEGERFEHTFKNIQGPIKFYILGGDDYTEQLTLQTVEKPQLTKVEISYTVPEYVRWDRSSATEQISYQGNEVSLVYGTEVTIDLQSNKELKSLRCVLREEGKVIELGEKLGNPDAVQKLPNPKAYRVKFTLKESLPIDIELVDNDGIQPPEPFRLSLRADEDKEPSVEAHLKGITDKITKRAKIPLELTISDDYGIQDLRFRYRIERYQAPPEEGEGEEPGDDKEPGDEGDKPKDGDASFEGTGVLALADDDKPADKEPGADDKKPADQEPGADPGDTGEAGEPKEPAKPKEPEMIPVEITADAEGKALILPQLKFKGLVAFNVVTFDLNPKDKLYLEVVAVDGDNIKGPHKGKSETFMFTVVTDDELLATLAERELNLRIRFEQILSDLKKARESLRDFREMVVRLDELAEGGPKADVEAWNALGLEMRKRLESIIQEVTKSGNETSTVSYEFSEILDIMINNEIDNVNLRRRIDEGIVAPLEDAIAQYFPDTRQGLEKVRGFIQKDNLLREVQISQSKMDLLVEQCESILAQMMKVENYNAMIKLLQGIREDLKKQGKDIEQKLIDEIENSLK